MNFIIDGVPVTTERLGYPQGGHILQLFISTEEGSGPAEELCRKLYPTLLKQQGGSGVMVDSTPDPHGRMEVRVLGGLEFPTLLTMVTAGFSVRQVE